MASLEHPLSVGEVAEALGISIQKVQRRIRAQKIEAHKLPGRTGAYLISADELKRLQDEQKTSVPA